MLVSKRKRYVLNMYQACVLIAYNMLLLTSICSCFYSIIADMMLMEFYKTYTNTRNVSTRRGRRDLYFILITLIQLTSVHITFGKHVACMHKKCRKWLLQWSTSDIDVLVQQTYIDISSSTHL